MLPYTPALSYIAEIAVQRLLELHSYVAASALDLGCGNGQKTFPLCKYFKTVVGVDASPHMIDDAIAHRGESCATFIRGDFAKIPVDDASVDVVTMWNSLHYADPKTLIPELKRVLRNGLVFICEPGPASRYGFSDHKDADAMLARKLIQIDKVRREFMDEVEVISYAPTDMGYTLVCRV